VQNSVIPGYQAVIDKLTELNKDNEREGGLPSLPDGKEYYEVYVGDAVGTNKVPENIAEIMDYTISENMSKIFQSSIQSAGESLYEILENPPYPKGTPEEQLDFLKEAMTKEYPEVEGADYILKRVDKSLEDMSPAFYLTPPIDDPDYNVVYLNDAKIETQAGGVFPVLAHEAYPGHLYQTVYFSNTNPDPVRAAMNFSGYVEGWATYIEHRTGEIAGLETQAAEVLKANAQLTICLYGRIDVGVNHEGWTKSDTADYLSDFNITDDETIQQMYDAMVAEPANYMKYALGAIEFEQLRLKSEQGLKGKFDLKEFHKFILDMGPAPFYIIDDWMDDWIKSQK
jgi:uncharacterized protein (DUF885 family)